jgi:thymidylate kinase
MTITIELVGLCGAGKTTLAGKLSPFLAGAGLRLFSRPQPSGAAALSAAGILAARMLGKRPRETASLLTSSAGRHFIAKLGYRVAGLRYKPAQATLISESGVVQPIISFEAQNNYAATAIPLDAILSEIPRPEILVRIDLAPEIAFERYCRRESAHTHRIEGTLETFSRAQEALDKICRFYTERQGQVIVFNSSAIDNNAVNMLVEKLRAATAQSSIIQ